MSDWRLRWMALALVTVVAGVACDDNPVDEGIDEPARLSVNPTFAVVDAADTTTVTGFAVNEFGSPTLAAMQFSGCDSKVEVTLDPDRVAIEPPDRALVIGRTLGSSCVNVDGPGDLSATADINVVPADMEVTAPGDEFRSGETATVDVTYFDAAGSEAQGFDKSQVAFSTDAPAVASVSADGTVSPKAPGDATVTASLLPEWGAERTTTFTFSVVPGVFTGTLSPSSVVGADPVAIAPGSGLQFDNNTIVTVAGVHPWIASSGADEISIRAPYGVPAGDNEVLLTGIGADQIAQAGTLTYTADASADPFEPNDMRTEGEAPYDASFPLDIWGAVAGTDLDDWFTITFAQETDVHIRLEWVTAANGDLDLLIQQSATVGDYAGWWFDCTSLTASGNVPEDAECTVPAGTYWFWLNNYDAEANGVNAIANYHLVIEPL